MSEVDIAYAKSPLCSGRHAGARWAPKGYGGPPPGAGHSPKFVLYAGNLSQAGLVTGKFPKLLEGAPRLSPDDHTYVVRPDGYVGLTAGADNWGEVDQYLMKWS